MKRFLKNTDGATSIEYAFIIALIVIGIVVAVTQIGSKVSTSYNNTANAFH